ncbi:S1 family peptidase [Dictyobacter arantiisoli]|nr:serine protease [Dictyobacter arantiisoli]
MPSSFDTSIVYIMDATGKYVIGAGFLISNMEILTCAHVIAQALELHEDNDHRQALPQHTLIVGFKSAPLEQRYATVREWYPQGDKDLAVLRLEKAYPDVANATCMVVVPYEDMWNHTFRAFGFPDRYDNGVWTSGRILGRDNRGFVQLESTHVTGHRIEQGFSGTPVWDEQANAVVGVIVEADRQSATKTAFMLPTLLIQDISARLGRKFLSIEQPVRHKKIVPSTIFQLRIEKKYFTAKHITIYGLSLLLLCMLLFFMLNYSTLFFTKTTTGATSPTPALAISWRDTISPDIQIPAKVPENATTQNLQTASQIGIVHIFNAHNPPSTIPMYHVIVDASNQSQNHDILTINAVSCHIVTVSTLPARLNVWHQPAPQPYSSDLYTAEYHSSDTAGLLIEAYPANSNQQPIIYPGQHQSLDIGLSSTWPAALDFSITITYQTLNHTYTASSSQIFHVFFVSDEHNWHFYQPIGAGGKFVANKS